MDLYILFFLLSQVVTNLKKKRFLFEVRCGFAFALKLNVSGRCQCKEIFMFDETLKVLNSKQLFGGRRHLVLVDLIHLPTKFSLYKMTVCSVKRKKGHLIYPKPEDEIFSRQYKLSLN